MLLLLKAARYNFVQVSLMNIQFRRNAFVWNRSLYNIIYYIIVTFDQCKASLLNLNINFYNLLTKKEWNSV